MTLGENIKNKRTNNNITQKDLAEKLSVSFQTISKWENNTNEPDIASLKELCKIFNCSMDELTNSSEGLEVVQEANKIEEKQEEKKVQVGICKDCGRPIYGDEIIHHMDRKSSSGIKEIVDVCDDCFKIHEKLSKQKEELLKPTPKAEPKNIFSKIGSRDDSKVLVWAIVVGIVAVIVSLVCCLINKDGIGIGWSIGISLIVGYVLLTDVYCIFSASWVSEVFVGVASWSIKFPGIIFSFSLDGLKFLILMKLLFWVLGVMISIATFILALVFSSICSIFTFPFLVIYNKKNYN